jgi:UDP-sulfoquinovose synthase
VSNRKFCNLGLDPITLDAGLFDEVTEVVKKYKNRCNPRKILPASFWNKKRAEECASLDPDSIKIGINEERVVPAVAVTHQLNTTAA